MKINFRILTICICFQMLCNAQSNKIDYVDNTEFPKGRVGTITENIINTINANDGDK